MITQKARISLRRLKAIIVQGSKMTLKELYLPELKEESNRFSEKTRTVKGPIFNNFEIKKGLGLDTNQRINSSLFKFNLRK